MKKITLTTFTARLKAFSLKRYVPRLPESIWFFVLSVFAVINIASFAFGILFFFRIGDINSTPTTEHAIGDIETINRTELEELLEVLVLRESTFESLTGAN